MEAGEGPVTTEKDLSTVPFIYDARNKVGVLRGPAGDGELVVRSSNVTRTTATLRSYQQKKRRAFRSTCVRKTCRSARTDE